jgi:extradiol dioxygenase family protein|tara:strand:+ start:158 stop:424 length:267 start_codon:yes stop_codon:yes gene_type:complete
VQALPELIAELEKHREACVKMSETLPINDVENLANSIQKIGEKYQYGCLVRWGEELAEQTSMFNLDKISILLKEYPNLIAELKTQEAT